MLTLEPRQERARDIIKERPRYALFWSCGLGKTIATLAGIGAVPIKTVVVAPKTVARSAWANDAKWFASLRTVVLEAEDSNREAVIRGDWDVLVTNYEMFKRYGEMLLSVGARRLVIDESSKVKNPESQITKDAIRFADRCESVYVLSGTPAPNNGTEYWGQLRCVSVEAAGPTYWGFAYKYFVPQKKTKWIHGKKREVIVGWDQTPQQREAFLELLRKWSWTLDKASAGLPEQSDRLIYLDLDEREAKVYAECEHEARLTLSGSVGDGVKVSETAVTMKLRQIVGGQVLVNGEAKRIGRTKIEALGELLDQIGEQEPVVIWAEFRADIDAICELLDARGESFRMIDGRNSDEAHSVVQAFQSGEIRRVVCQPASVGHGVTLTAAAYSVYYGLGWSHETHEQSRDRIHRKGQKRPCLYYYLLAKGTIDEACFAVVKRKKAASAAIRGALRMEG